MIVASTILALTSGVVATILPPQLLLTVDTGKSCPAETAGSCNPEPLAPARAYFGSQTQNCSIPTKLRISNGGAGLAGLVGRLADEFIEFELKANTGAAPFKIEWIVGDTTETIEYLGNNKADVGITYHKAAECEALKNKAATRREYGFRDHFYLVGPKDDGNGNPAGLKPANLTDGHVEDLLEQFQKIVRTGNQPPQSGRRTRFLSRHDKSATNIKESELFTHIGQVPWGLTYSKWYHEFVVYPIEALEAASLLQEYTITDRGTWLSTKKEFTDKLTIYNLGLDKNPADPLLNPAFFLTSNSSCPTNAEVANRFLNWVIAPEGQKVIESFKQDGSSELLYTPAPSLSEPDQRLRNCSITGI